jgi:hypothetical protein
LATVCWARARPDDVELLAAGELLGLPLAPEPPIELLELLLELQAASSAAAVSAAPGASQRFQVCVITLCLHRTGHDTCVNGCFLLRYACRVAKPKASPSAT